MSKFQLSTNDLVNNPIERLCQARNNVISVNQHLQEFKTSDSAEIIQLLYDSEEQLNLLQRWFMRNYEFIAEALYELDEEN